MASDGDEGGALVSLLVVRLSVVLAADLILFLGGAFHEVAEMVDLLVVNLAIPDLFDGRPHAEFGGVRSTLLVEERDARCLVSAGLRRDHAERIATDGFDDTEVLIDLIIGAAFVSIDLPRRDACDVDIVDIDIGWLLSSHWPHSHERVPRCFRWRLLCRGCHWL